MNEMQLTKAVAELPTEVFTCGDCHREKNAYLDLAHTDGDEVGHCFDCVPEPEESD